MAGAVSGVGLWASLGVLAVESAGPRAPRLGVLPRPAFLVSAVLLLALGAFLAQRFSWLKRVSGWYYPLYCTAIVALPWLPVPVRASALVWAGPAAWWIWAAVGMAIAVILAGSALFARPSWLTSRLGPPWAHWTAAALAALIYGGAAIYLTPVFPGGDEPHYLVITQSLLKDGDLRIENNHQRQDYLEYYNGALSPHYLKRGADGEIYSVHAPGLPALLLPAFMAGGYPGAVIFLVLVASLLSMLVWHAAFLATSRPGAAWFGWAGVMLSTPVWSHAFAVYPETTGAAVVMAGVVALVGVDRASGGPEVATQARAPSATGPFAWPWGRWLLIGAGLGLLPWLHTRYVVLAAVIGLVLAGRLVGRPRAWSRMLALFALPAASAVAWFGFFKVVYGTFSPAAPYGHYTQTALAHVPGGLQGLLFDQQFGLLPAAPVFAAALVGFVAIARTRQRLAVELFALVLSYAVAVATYRMWWGGWSAAARFLVPVLPVLAVPAAAWWNTRQAGGRLIGGTLLGLGLLTSATELLVGRGMLIFNPRDAVSRLYEWLSPLVDANRALPTLFRPETTPPLPVAAVWVGVLAAGAVGLSWWVRRWHRVLAVRCTVAIAAAALLGLVALELGWAVQGVRPLAGTGSQLALLEAAPRRPPGIGLSFRPFAIDDPLRLVTRLRLSPSARRARRQDDPAYQLTAVPAGVYRLDNMSVASVTATLFVRIGRGRFPVETWPVDPGTRTIERTLRLPCSVNAVVIDSEGTRRAGLSRLTLQPVEAWPGDGCPESRAHRGARYGGATVLFFDASADPEERGFWVRGRAETVVAVTPDRPASAVTLEVLGGATEVRVRFVSGAWNSGLTLPAGERQWVHIPVEPKTGAALVRINADNGFVPSSINPASQDRRFLGCWVTVPE